MLVELLQALARTTGREGGASAIGKLGDLQSLASGNVSDSSRHNKSVCFYGLVLSVSLKGGKVD